ncbi:MAG: NnrS family protein [Gammaproteobacteria bacterium]|jgi:uncharacterized protein involved in response to NO|nr:NnrS family protein [Gammaproteobacteria bacterium]
MNMNQIGNSSPVFFSKPHRVMFFTGSFQIMAVILFWLSELIGRYTDLWPPLDITVSSTWAHTFFMVYGVFIFFIFGFLMTTYPRWLNTQDIPSKHYLPCFFLMSAAIVLIYSGLFISRPLLLSGLAVFTCGWAFGLFALLNVYFHPGKKPSSYETILSVVMSFGLMCCACNLFWLLTYKQWLFQILFTGGIWLFLLPVLITVCYRMIPFFSGAVLENYVMHRPNWSLPLIIVCLCGHACIELIGEIQWSFLFDFPLAITALYLSYRWGFLRSFKVPLLTVLHVGFLWLSIAMLLYGMQSLALFISGKYILGRAPLHAIGIGFVSSMMLAMATRVSLGHSGRALMASKIVLACFCLLQLAAVSRIVSEIPQLFQIWTNHLNLAAAIIWLLSFGIWVSIFMPIYIKSRIDGNPG